MTKKESAVNLLAETLNRVRKDEIELVSLVIEEIKPENKKGDFVVINDDNLYNIELI